MLPLVSTMPAFSAIGVKCGQKICEAFQYCSAFHNDCEDCSKICEENHHNYDETECKEQCRDYLHDRSYVKRSDFDAEIKHMKVYLTVTFVLVVILLILFIAVNGPKLFRTIRKFFASWRLQKKKEKSVEPVTMANPNTESPKMRRNHNANHQHNLNRTSSIFTVSGTEYDQKTVSTPISRHPAEDTLTSTITSTDYSYDNKALQLTPVSTEKPKIETNF